MGKSGLVERLKMLGAHLGSDESGILNRTPWKEAGNARSLWKTIRWIRGLKELSDYGIVLSNLRPVPSNYFLFVFEGESPRIQDERDVTHDCCFIAPLTKPTHHTLQLSGCSTIIHSVLLLNMNNTHVNIILYSMSIEY